MIEIAKHIIHKDKPVSASLVQLNNLGSNLTLFVIDDNQKLVGTLTDGDIRRGLIKQLSVDHIVDEFMNTKFTYLKRGAFTVDEVQSIKKRKLELVPIVDDGHRIVKIVNLRDTITILPLDVVIMAGGEGRRLRPFTEKVPKPLLKIGDKPIIEHNIDRLIKFGVDDFWICLRYLGEQIESYFGNGSAKNINVNYVWERDALGTIGAITKVDAFKHEHVLVTNSDLLTDVDYEDFYLDFIKNDADISIVTIPYRVGIPYAVLETRNGHVISFSEKPTYTYYSNGGIYLMKRSLIDLIPKNAFFNATDLIEKLISDGRKVVSYPLTSYWLDIGRVEDFEKAKLDIVHLKL
jgi:dTDP-glucose pyrophosphorylase